VAGCGVVCCTGTDGVGPFDSGARSQSEQGLACTEPTIKLQAILELHRPYISQHHIKAVPATKPHDVLNIQASTTKEFARLTGRLKG